MRTPAWEDLKQRFYKQNQGKTELGSCELWTHTDTQLMLVGPVWAFVSLCVMDEDDLSHLPPRDPKGVMVTIIY